MIPYDQILVALKERLPEAKVTHDPSLNPEYGFIDVTCKGVTVVLEYRPIGYGVSKLEFSAEPDPYPDIFSGPDEVYLDLNQAIASIAGFINASDLAP